MRRGTRTWKLKYMVIMHILVIIGATVAVTYMGRYYTGIWSLFILIGLTFLKYKLIQNMYEYIDRIRDRKNRML